MPSITEKGFNRRCRRLLNQLWKDPYRRNETVLLNVDEDLDTGRIVKAYGPYADGRVVLQQVWYEPATQGDENQFDIPDVEQPPSLIRVVYSEISTKMVLRIVFSQRPDWWFFQEARVNQAVVKWADD